MTEPENPTVPVLKAIKGEGIVNISAEVERAVRAGLADGTSAHRYALLAELTQLKYRSLLAAGFTEPQALYLIGVAPC